MKVLLTSLLFSGSLALSAQTLSPGSSTPLQPKSKPPVYAQEALFELGEQKLTGKAPCKYDELQRELFSKDASAKLAFDRTNEEIRKLSLQKDKLQKAGVIRIPVVFHIMHIGEAVGQGANISTVQVQ
ncbi:MAG: hypothetical protein V4616_03060, partial [Bacteroidota bacterium]